MDIAVDAHRHQRMPVLYLDLGDVADVDVGDTHPGVLLNDNHIGQLRLDRVRTVAVTFGSRQAQRVEAAPLTSRDRGHTHGDESHDQHTPHGVPPGGAAEGTIRPWSPWLGSVDVASGGRSPIAASAASGSPGSFSAAGTSGGVCGGRCGLSRSSLKVISFGRADAPTNGLIPSGGKLYCRFLMIGARY